VSVKNMILKSQYPSLKIAYEHVNQVLIQQKQTIRDYGMRAITLLATATAIAGVGIPLGFNPQLDDFKLCWGFTASDTVILPIILYVVIAIYAYYTYKLQWVKTEDQPEIIREHFWELEPDVFYHEMLIHTEEAFKHNQKIIKQKQGYLKPLISLVIIETLLVIFWAGFIIRLIPTSSL